MAPRPVQVHAYHDCFGFVRFPVQVYKYEQPSELLLNFSRRESAESRKGNLLIKFKEVAIDSERQFIRFRERDRNWKHVFYALFVSHSVY